MKKVTIVPSAAALIQSNRAIGYSFEAAVADIIDNSISANAKYVDIRSGLDGDNSYLAIVDDGTGMTGDELFNAMRYGSINPLEKRDLNDLGRFGLGMKVASLSQCSILTVISKKNTIINGCQWNLKIVSETGEWTACSFDSKECHDFPECETLDEWDSGTIVLWQDLDRIREKTASLEDTLNEYLQKLRLHLGMVFHRYISGDARHVTISINQAPVKAIDPFLQSNSHTQPRPRQKITYKNSTITISPYILPHFNNMTENERQQCDRTKAYRFQGFYVYRNRRLIIPGTWFGLRSRRELHDLARIMIDIPNTLDGEWNIDIKKSTADLPPDLKNKIISTLDDSLVRSVNVHRSRGRKVSSKTGFIWIKIDCGDHFRYEINREHPLVQELMSSNDSEYRNKIRLLISMIEDSVPYESIIGDLAEKEATGINNDDEQMQKYLEYAIQFIDNGADPEVVCQMEPYSLYPELINYLRDRYGQ